MASIDIIEKGSMNAAIAGWIGSRSLDEAVHTHDLAVIDASVNELPSAVLYFRDWTILERELFVTPRNHIVWARTSRVDDVSQFTVPPNFEKRWHEEVRQQMRSRRDMGQPQDEWRMLLPLCAVTSWTARVNLRDLLRMAQYFEWVAGEVATVNDWLADHLDVSAQRMLDTAANAFDLPPKIINRAFATYKMPAIEHVVSDILEQDYYTTNSSLHFVTFKRNLPIALRAQLVRHRDVMVADSFVHLLKTTPQAEQCNIGARINVCATATREAWRALLNKRMCWMAQGDLWQSITEIFEGGGKAMLPCAGGVCPYGEDAKQRLAGNDPGAPCPRHSRLTKSPMTDAQIDAAKQQIGRMKNLDARIFWQAETAKVPSAPFTTCDECQIPACCEREKHCDRKHNGYR